MRALHQRVNHQRRSATLQRIRLIGQHFQVVSRRRRLPRFIVEAHRIKEYAIHIKKHGLRSQLLEAVIFQIVLYSLYIIVHHSYLSSVALRLAAMSTSGDAGSRSSAMLLSLFYQLFADCFAFRLITGFG